MDKPLALKLAPKSLKEVYGQSHLIGKDRVLTNMVKNKKIFSMILYGRPGIGKTSIANAIVNELGLRYRFLNATINNKKDLDIVIEEAKMYPIHVALHNIFNRNYKYLLTNIFSMI